MIRQILMAVFILFTVFTLWSCNHSEEVEAFSKKVYPELSGQYDLVQRYYSNWNGNVTPNKIDYFEMISINMEGTYQEYRDGKSISRLKYYVGKKTALVGQPDSVYVMSFA